MMDGSGKAVGVAVRNLHMSSKIQYIRDMSLHVGSIYSRSGRHEEWRQGEEKGWGHQGMELRKDREGKGKQEKVEVKDIIG